MTTPDRDRIRAALDQHNALDEAERGACGPLLAALLGELGPGAEIGSPFHCATGRNLRIGAGARLGPGCVIWDTAPVRIGRRTVLWPGVRLYCEDPAAGGTGAPPQPVLIGAGVVIEEGAVVLPGLHIGDGAVIKAGSVVSRNVPQGARVAGSPARRL